VKLLTQGIIFVCTKQPVKAMKLYQYLTGVPASSIDNKAYNFHIFSKPDVIQKDTKTSLAIGYFPEHYSDFGQEMTRLACSISSNQHIEKVLYCEFTEDLTIDIFSVTDGQAKTFWSVDTDGPSVDNLLIGKELDKSLSQLFANEIKKNQWFEAQGYISSLQSFFNNLYIQYDPLPKKTLEFDYGKVTLNKTAIIRFLIPDKKDIISISNFWNKFCNNTQVTLEDFSKEFSKVTYNARNRKFEWCKHSYMCNGYQPDPFEWQYGPENLMYGIRFVILDDQFLYVGFDLEGLGLYESQNLSTFVSEFSTLQRLLLEFKGVKKIWMKIRPENQSEYFCEFPLADGEPGLYLLYAITDENDWDTWQKQVKAVF